MNMINIGLAFLEGLALIAMPCILPVLPLVLAASVSGGRRRPYGIIMGFVLAFSMFAIVARQVVLLLGLDLDLIKDVSLALLTLFGVVLLSSKLSEKFSALSQGAANIGNTFTSTGGGGLRSGILIGSLIGLVWTPCAGPILAAVLVQVIRQQSDFAGNLIIVAFAIGAGVPMLIIALSGRKIMNKLGFFAKHAEAVRRSLGALILASVAFIASGMDVQSLFTSSRKIAEPSRAELKLEKGLNFPYDAPQFSGIDAWFNSQPLTMQGLKGKVVLVDFWTYSCINCVRTLPYVTDWDKKYRSQGLVIVGVHSSEFEFEKKLDNVKAAIAQHGINYPVALDNHLDTWSNFSNRYWPAHYLINKEGKVVYTHFGEGEYDVTENNIRFLLGIKGQAAPISVEQMGYAPEQVYEMLAKGSGNIKKESQPRIAKLKKETAQIPEAGKMFKDCPDCPDMVVIPVGSFDMGSNNGEADEKPIHRITISKAFSMGRTEVTQLQWRAIMGKNPSWFKKCGDECPVEQVRWIDTQQFIQMLNARTGKQYRLPSEAEWEYACRAGGQQEYCGSNNVDSVAWYKNNSGITTHPAASKQANAFGLYGMSGNVWEWVADSWHDNYNGAPVDGSVWQGASSRRVLRGGSWNGEPQVARAAMRDWNELTARIGTGGFRLARSIP